MVVLLRYLLISIIFIIINTEIKGQADFSKNDMEIRFFKDNVEIKPGKSFFNILSIKNKSDRNIEFNVQFNTPKGWEIIGNAFEKYSLSAHESINLPVRAAVSKDAKGGVGYVIVATVTDKKGATVATEYSFSNLPVESDVKVKTSKSSLYFDHKDLSSSFTVKFNNTGNIDEIVNVKLVPENSISIEGSQDNILIEDVTVPVSESKEVSYNINLKEDIDFQKFQFHRVNLFFNLTDTVINRTVWFKYLDWKFENVFSNNEKPLNLEATAYNLFNKGKTLYRFRAYGKILLKNKRDIRYSFENINRDSYSNNLWVNSRFLVQFNTPKTMIYIGDNTRNYEQNMTGRGISIAQKIKNRSEISGTVTRRLTRDVNKFGTSFSHRFKIPLSFELGGAYVDELDQNIKSYLGYGEISGKVAKNYVFSMLYANSQTNDQSNNLNAIYNGWGYRANFRSTVKKLKLGISSEYGSPNYTGYTKGRFLLNGTASMHVFEKSNIQATYYNQAYRPSYRINDIYVSDRSTKSQFLNIKYLTNIISNIFLFAGPEIEQKSTNSYFSMTPENPFSTYSAKGEVGLMVFQKYSGNSVSFSGKYGFTNVYQYPTELNETPATLLGNDVFNIAELTFNIKRKYFNVNLIYYHGPYSISQEFVYFYTNFFSRSLNIMPTYERFLYKKALKMTLRGSYIYNIATKNNRIYLNSSLDWYANKGWTFRFLNTTSYQKTNSSSDISSYATTYFEFAIRKSFNINQPRLKYFNYKAVFYKDLNGNRKHDVNEPGVSRVLSDIKRNDPLKDIQDPNYNGEFINNDLLSNQEGNIEYMNMPEGEYKIKYTPQNINLGTFETETVEKVFQIHSDTVMHIPFLERNKLFGKVNLNRTKHTALGEIPIDNIKITVEGNDKTYSSLTDKDGNFELYIPVADYYKVKITNIFREHFTLRNEYYIVKFNGYKRFELSFDFDEKERTIAFDESDFLIDDDDVIDGDFTFDDIKVIKQTNLKGIIKDANSLIPIHSTISVFNGSGELISETASSNRTGVYFTSFFAGDNYYLKAYSKGYWVYTENLNIQQVTTFENINLDVMLKKIIIDEEIKEDKFRFKSESAELTPLAKAELDNILALLSLNPSIHIEISGHTDNIETLLVNAKQLSVARASAVAAYLVKNGMKENQIKIIARGNSDPKSKEDSEDGRTRNRRVDIKVAGF